MAHMWFGDFVTCPWWDELWLNEAFASYFTFVGLEESSNNLLTWDPATRAGSWDLGVQVITGELPYALSADQTITSNPIVNQANNGDHVVTGHRAAGSSSIIYSKGAVILKMIRCHLGDATFFGGLKNYLEKFKFANPTTVDLFNAWDEYINNNEASQPSFDSKSGVICDGIGKSSNGPILPKSAAETFNPWVRQMGFPFLRVAYSPASDRLGGITIIKLIFKYVKNGSKMSQK